MEKLDLDVAWDLERKGEQTKDEQDGDQPETEAEIEDACDRHAKHEQARLQQQAEQEVGANLGITAPLAQEIGGEILEASGADPERHRAHEREGAIVRGCQEAGHDHHGHEADEVADQRQRGIRADGDEGLLAQAHAYHAGHR